MDKINFLNVTISLIILFSLFSFISLFINYDNIELGNGFVYNEERKDILGKIDIPPQIISYERDEKYVIVKQLPSKYHNVIYNKIHYEYTNGRNSIYYWLIEKNKQNVMGPMDSLDFIRILKEKKIELKFR